MATYKLPGVVLLTGAGGTGIGAATARAFASSGCPRLALTDINAASLEFTRQSVLSILPTAEVFTLAGDISSETFVDTIISETTKTFGRIDYLINCAGVVGKALRSHETDVSAFDFINGVNYRGVWLVSRAAYKVMMAQEPLPEHPGQRGSVVNIASQLGIVARSTAAPYCASKAAVINLTKSDAIDYSADRIRVNAVCPGVIETPMTTGQENWEEHLAPAIATAPMKRMGRPEEVAAAALWLASGEASFVQGHALVVDGGYVIN